MTIWLFSWWSEEPQVVRRVPRICQDQRNCRLPGNHSVLWFFWWYFNFNRRVSARNYLYFKPWKQLLMKGQNSKVSDFCVLDFLHLRNAVTYMHSFIWSKSLQCVECSFLHKVKISSNTQCPIATMVTWLNLT